MLAWPDDNIQIRQHEEDLEEDLQLVSDWLEGQILFGEEAGISLSEIVDIMLENQVSDDSDQCWFFVENALDRLRERHKAMETTSPIEFGDDNATLRPDRSHTALRFCTMLALGAMFRQMRAVAFVPHPDRGYLFERLAEDALATLFPRWKTVRTGWAPSQPADMDLLVRTMAEHLGERPGDFTYWCSRHAKDEGLDLCCYYPFGDMHSGYPVYLIQCATGTNWRKKTAKPSLEGWQKFIQFTCCPRRAFIIPFSLTQRDFRIHCNDIGGPLLDRYRLLSFDTPEEEWLSPDLARDLESWLAPRIDSLLALEQ